MSEKQTVECPICGKPYVFYPFYYGDQSVCPACQSEARKHSDWYRGYDYPYPKPSRKYFLQKI